MRKRMSSRAWDISSRCFLRVMPRRVALRSSMLPLRANEFSLVPDPGEGFLGTRLGWPRVVPILILSNNPAYSINAPKTNRTQTMTQASMAARNSKETFTIRIVIDRNTILYFWPNRSRNRNAVTETKSKPKVNGKY